MMPFNKFATILSSWLIELGLVFRHGLGLKWNRFLDVLVLYAKHTSRVRVSKVIGLFFDQYGK